MIKRHMQGNVLVGASWEGYVIEQISNVIKPDITLYFYRTYAGSEIDLVFVKSNMPVDQLKLNIPMHLLYKKVIQKRLRIWK